jgi:hypothetical protein
MELLELKYKTPKPKDKYAWVRPWSEKRRKRMNEFIDRRTKETIDKLKNLYGYNDQSAKDVLEYICEKVYAKGEDKYPSEDYSKLEN